MASTINNKNNDYLHFEESKFDNYEGDSSAGRFALA